MIFFGLALRITIISNKKFRLHINHKYSKKKFEKLKLNFINTKINRKIKI